MPTITIRNVEQHAYDSLKSDAKSNHRSLEAEARARVFRPTVSREEFVRRLREVRIDPGPDYEGSVALIRAIRDEE